MFDLLSRSWWTLVVRGIFAILFGILAFCWPGLTVVTLVIFFGTYTLVDGILAIVGAIRGWGKRDDHWLLLLGGLLGVGIGILTFRASGDYDDAPGHLHRGLGPLNRDSGDSCGYPPAE